MTIKISEGEYKGAYVYKEYSKEKDNIVIKPLPQIGFLKNEPPEYEYFLLDQIPHKSYLDNNGFDLKHSRCIRVFGIDVDTVRQILSEKKIKFEYQGKAGPSENHKEDLLCEVEYLIDSTIFELWQK